LAEALIAVAAEALRCVSAERVGCNRRYRSGAERTFRGEQLLQRLDRYLSKWVGKGIYNAVFDNVWLVLVGA
jgi:hypothetical protein